MSSLAVCLIHFGFTSGEHLEILLPPVHILNSFCRPCSNVCITYLRKHSLRYTHTSIYRKQIWFHEKKASHVHVYFFLSSHIGLWKCRILIFASYVICRVLYSRQKAVLIVEAPWSILNKRTGYIVLTYKGRMLQWIALYWSISDYLFQPPLKESSWIWAFSNLSATTIYIEACLYLYTLDNQCLSFPEVLLTVGFFGRKWGFFHVLGKAV